MIFFGLAMNLLITTVYAGQLSATEFSELDSKAKNYYKDERLSAVRNMADKEVNTVPLNTTGMSYPGLRITAGSKGGSATLKFVVSKKMSR